MNSATITRKTYETEIEVTLSPTPEKNEIITGVGFFDHMLHSMSLHGGFGMHCKAKGDLHVDAHHTIEDTGIAFGQALYIAVDKLGIERFAYEVIPMDESLASVALDFGGRAYLSFEADFPQEYVGEYPTNLTEEFFRAMVMAAGISMHIKVTGKNSHHMIEAAFKAVGRAIKHATARTGDIVPSTKGVL